MLTRGLHEVDGYLTFTLKRTIFNNTTSLSGMICFKATKHPAKIPSKPAISRYLRPTQTYDTLVSKAYRVSESYQIDNAHFLGSLLCFSVDTKGDVG